MVDVVPGGNQKSSQQKRLTLEKNAQVVPAWWGTPGDANHFVTPTHPPAAYRQTARLTSWLRFPLPATRGRRWLTVHSLQRHYAAKLQAISARTHTHRWTSRRVATRKNAHSQIWPRTSNFLFPCQRNHILSLSANITSTQRMTSAVISLSAHLSNLQPPCVRVYTHIHTHTTLHWFQGDKAFAIILSVCI